VHLQSLIILDYFVRFWINTEIFMDANESQSCWEWIWHRWMSANNRQTRNTKSQTTPCLHGI